MKLEDIKLVLRYSPLTDPTCDLHSLPSKNEVLVLPTDLDFLENQLASALFSNHTIQI